MYFYIMADHETYDIVKADFDEIAELSEPTWNHNNCYFKYLLSLVPEHSASILDIGCGKGKLSSMLAERADRVTAVDLSEKMIEYARLENSGENIEYVCGNILDMQFDDASLDVIITTATAHHLPYEWLLSFSKDKLRDGGTLIILDLVRAETVGDYLLWAFAAIPNIFMNLLHNGKLHKDDGHSKAVWQRHGRHDTYMTLKEIRKITNKICSGATVKRKLFWRYVLIWNK